MGNRGGDGNVAAQVLIGEGGAGRDEVGGGAVEVTLAAGCLDRVRVLMKRKSCTLGIRRLPLPDSSQL